MAFVVAYGDLSLLLDREVAHARSQTKYRCVYLDAENVKSNAFVAACNSTDFYDERPLLVVLDNAQAFRKSGELTSYLETPNDVQHLIVVRSEKLPALWSTVKSKVRQWTAPAPWEDDKVLGFIALEARRCGVTFEEGAAERLLVLVGHDYETLVSQIQKFAVLKTPITVDLVRSLVSGTAVPEPFTIVETAIQGQVKKTIALASRYYGAHGEQGHVHLTVSMMKQTERLLKATSWHGAGLAEDQIAANLGMHPYRYKKTLGSSVGKRSPQFLVSFMRELCNLDQTVKSTNSAKRFAVELALVTLASS